MSFISIEKDINFSDNILNCQITKINKEKVSIFNAEIKFQKNRTIIITLYSNETIEKDNISKIEGKYFNYNFSSTISESIDGSFSMYRDNFVCEYILIVDLIEFSNNNTFFINSKEKHDINIFPSKNFSSYIEKEISRKNNINKKKLKEYLSNKNINQIDFSKDRDFILDKNINSLTTDNYIIDEYVVNIKILNKDKELAKLFNFTNIRYEDYDLKIKYIMELYTMIFDSPILIEKVLIDKNILFQSQSLNINLIDEVTNKDDFFRNNHFTISLYKYLDKFLDFRKSNSILNNLLKEYFLREIYNGKEFLNLNDISGLIDLFDSIYNILDGKKEKKSVKCKKCDAKNSFEKEYPLKYKIDYVIDKLEPELKKYRVDNDNNTSVFLSKFRHSIRHQLDNNLEIFNDISTKQKAYDFTHGILKLFIIKQILQIDIQDYNLNRILSDFRVYPLVKHTYSFFDKEVFIYNTQQKENFYNKTLSKNTTYFLTLKEYKEFESSNPEDFIYDEKKSLELKKVYIDKEDKLRNSLLHSGIIVIDDKIYKSDKYNRFNNTYEDFKSNLELI